MNAQRSKVTRMGETTGEQEKPDRWSTDFFTVIIRNSDFFRLFVRWEVFILDFKVYVSGSAGAKPMGMGRRRQR